MAVPLVSLPTGTVTFLFTDIEGSTKLLQRLGEHYAQTLWESQRLLRQAWAEHGGVEVDTQGDSFFVAFSSAVDAVVAAAAATRALAAHPWPEGTVVRVRMGLHTGTPQLSVPGDRYVGLDVHRAARIAAAGHGGQILLSESTRALAEQRLPEGANLRDLGAHWLKDLQAPEPLAQLILVGLPDDFPPLKTLDRHVDHVPVPPTPFVGRERELALLQRLLSDPGVRLITLVGLGGMGKTRLAIEAAHQNSASFQGTYFVSLALARSSDDLLFGIAEALGYPFVGEKAPVVQLGAYVADKPLLLVLDNFEHLVDSAPVLTDLQARAPALKLLVTSRERLNLAGEGALPIDSVDVPTTTSGDQWEVSSAIQLFLQSAQRVQPEFALHGNEDEALRICQLVEGMPLAIELAAAWVRLLPCAQIVARLERSADFLASSRRDAPERHRSLRAVFDSSWDLLAPDEQAALARLAMLRGAFDLDAAEAVGGAELPLVASLSDKSLLQPDSKGGYALHELTRQYAAERLAQEPDVAALRERAITYLTDDAERARAAAAPSRVAALLAQAVSIAQDAGRADQVERLRHKRGLTLMQMGRWTEARPELESAIAPGGAGTMDEQIQALIELGETEFYLHDVEGARRHVGEALERAEAAQRSELALLAMAKRGFLETNEGNVEQAIALYEHVLAHGGAPLPAQIEAHASLGRTFYWLGRYPEAVSHARTSLALAPSESPVRLLPLQDLGLALAATGAYGEADEAFGEARRISQRFEVWPLVARSVSCMAGYHLDIFDYAGNEALAEEARLLARAADMTLSEVSSGLDLLFNYARREEPERAAKILPEVAEAVIKAGGSHGWLWRLRLAQARAELAAARTEWEEALRLVELSLQHSRAMKRVKYQVWGLRTRAQARAALGDLSTAHTDLREALDLARPTTDPALFLIVAAALLEGERDDALTREAKTAAQRIRAALPTDAMRYHFDDAAPVREIAQLVG
jgi:predicted ATPase/class 3 adenylate cyclase